MKITSLVFMFMASSASQIIMASQPTNNADLMGGGRSRFASQSTQCRMGSCCMFCLFMICCHNQFIATDKSKMWGDIKGLEGTRHGRMAIEYFKKQGEKEGFEKGLTACLKQSTTSPTMIRTAQEEMQDKYHPNSFAGHEPKMKRD